MEYTDLSSLKHAFVYYYWRVSEASEQRARARVGARAKARAAISGWGSNLCFLSKAFL